MNPDLRCAEARELLGAALDGELSTAARVGVERHLRECAACQKHLEEHQAVWALLGEARLPPPSRGDAEFLAAVRARAQRAAHRGPSRRAVLAAAAAALLLAGLGLYFVLPRGEEQAIIENLAILEDLQAGRAGGPGVVEVSRELLALLAEEDSSASSEEWIDLLEAALEEGGKGG